MSHGRAVTSATDRPSEVAKALTVLVAQLEPEEREQLGRLLAHSLAAPTRAELRENVLGLLAELVRHGGVVTTIEYEDERAHRAAQGQEWPSHTTLIRRYGSARRRYGDGWQKACEAALRFVHLGGLSRVPATYRHAGAGTRYLRSDATLAIREFYWLYRSWPTQWDYEEWARVRKLHGTDRRLPGLAQVRKLFGSWTRAVDVAQREETTH